MSEPTYKRGWHGICVDGKSVYMFHVCEDGYDPVLADWFSATVQNEALWECPKCYHILFDERDITVLARILVSEDELLQLEALR